MLKAWSITTTVRNPERLRDFLVALQPLAGKAWDHANQEKYQRLLIKHRLYGYGSAQFYNGLPRDLVDLVNDVDTELDDATVERIVDVKNYTDFAMRGRQSLNPLTKFGFALIEDGTVKITDLGRKLIASEKDAGDVFLKSFIKWQIPNPANDDYANNDDYDVVPFVATLKLISEVNRLEAERGNKPVGLSKREFCLFVPSLVKHEDITAYAYEVIRLRDVQKGKSTQERKQVRDTYRHNFATQFLDSSEQLSIDKLLTNLRDYGDNAIRYFRLTKFIRIRGNGFYVDLETSRHTEIAALLEGEFYKPQDFADRAAYLQYMSDDALPKLPWQTKDKLVAIAREVYAEVSRLETETGLSVQEFKDTAAMSEDELSAYIAVLRSDKKLLQEKDNHIKAQPLSALTDYIEKLENIYEYENRALMLEHLATMGLHALNDAIEIRPNYPVGDDNEPTSTAPGGMADIECYYKTFTMICEVTMLKGRDQWFNEGQPVMRHLRDFEINNSNAYCIFVAPTIHADSAETFWIANAIGYKGSRQRIAPLTISQFVSILQTLKGLREVHKNFTHEQLEDLVQSITDSAQTIPNSDEWVANIASLVASWSNRLTAGGA
jgi:hypothetical protein